MAEGILYICATPIGNLQDASFRLIHVLKEVDVVAAEDTRITRRLLQHYGIKTPLVSYHAHSPESRTGLLVKHLTSGESVALVCNAGTPGISDPGVPLVNAAIAAGVRVIPIPGPCALIAALSASGFPAQQFSFLGFLPKKSGQRRRAIQELARDPRTVVIYESPERITDTLRDLATVLGGRRVAVFREITKLHEASYRGALPEVTARIETATPRGEFTLVIEGAAKIVEEEQTDLEGYALDWLNKQAEPLPSTRDLVVQLAGKTGWSRKHAYQFVLQWKQARRARPLPPP